MNCCEQNAPNGGCNQGRDCPVRTTRLNPNLSEADPLPVWYAGDEPVLPLHRTELLLVWGGVMLTGLTTAVLIVVGIGYSWQRWLA